MRFLTTGPGRATRSPNCRSIASIVIAVEVADMCPSKTHNHSDVERLQSAHRGQADLPTSGKDRCLAARSVPRLDHVSAKEVEKIVEAAQGLQVEPRGDRWCHLSLCVIDAVFSIGARYGSTWRAARRYATHAGLDPATAPAREVAPGDVVGGEQPLDDFRADVSGLSEDDLAEILGNRQRTSSRGGILKALAARQYVEVLASHEVQTLRDVSILLCHQSGLVEVEAELARVRGHGAGVRVTYLWMLAGGDDHVKADRMVIRWASQVLGRQVRPNKAADLVIDAAASLGATPWELDHAIWRRKAGSLRPRQGRAR